jgi:hypothetical protein
MTDLAHPASRHHRTRPRFLWTALFAVPCMWALRLVVNYAIDSHFCFPSEIRRSHLPTWAWPTLLSIDLATIAVAAAAALISQHYWRRAQDEVAPRAPLIESGEGSARFLAMWGLIISIGFLVAVLFDLVGLWIVPVCG